MCEACYLGKEPGISFAYIFGNKKGTFYILIWLFGHGPPKRPPQKEQADCVTDSKYTQPATAAQSVPQGSRYVIVLRTFSSQSSQCSLPEGNKPKDMIIWGWRKVKYKTEENTIKE